jgi:hypothetical protein
MKNSVNVCSGRLLSLSVVTFAIIFQGLVWQSRAEVYTLQDGDSQATVDSAGGGGMSSWTIDGQDQLVKQWFYYRVGSVGANAGIQNLGQASFSQPNNWTLDVTYGTAQSPLTVDVRYTMAGGSSGSGTAAIGETLTIHNNSPSASLDLHFFEYCNFNLGGLANSDSVQIFKSPPTPAGKVFLASQTGGNINLSETVDAETVVAPGAMRGEVDYANTPNNTLSRLLGGTPYDLNNNLGNAGGPLGPGDVSWAFQWDKTVGAGSDYIISKNKNISGVVPEPSTLALISLGLVGWGLRRRRSA